MYNEYIDNARNLIVLNKDKVFAIYQDAQYQNEKIKLESELRDLLQKKQELEPYINDYATSLKQAKDEAKKALEEASRINEVNLEKGMPESLKNRFKTLGLSDDIGELDNEIYQIEAEKLSVRDVDERTVQEYEERQKMIDKLEKEFKKIEEKLKSHQNNYEALRNEWIESVEEMIAELNEKFSHLFQQLKCSGEVSLGKPDNLEEFSKYGVTIRVSLFIFLAINFKNCYLIFGRKVVV